MTKGELRESVKNSAGAAVDDIESSFNDILAIAETIDLEDADVMKSGIEEIISELQNLAYKLY